MLLIIHFKNIQTFQMFQYAVFRAADHLTRSATEREVNPLAPHLAELARGLNRLAYGQVSATPLVGAGGRWVGSGNGWGWG